MRSGTLNAGGAFAMRATTPAAQSTDAGIVALVKQAGADNAPVVRLADRFATWFLPLSLLAAARAWWASGLAERAVAVLVVATRARCHWPRQWRSSPGCRGRRGAASWSAAGGALENLGRAATMVLDKTGTLTVGRPAVTDVLTAPGWAAGDVLRLAASADQVSPHVLAEAVAAEARPPASRCRCRSTLSRSPAAVSRPGSTGGSCGSASAPTMDVLFTVTSGRIEARRAARGVAASSAPPSSSRRHLR